MRLFVAIPVPETIRKSIGEITRQLKKSTFLHSKVKWVALENLHFTLKFLGETPDDRLEILRQALGEVVIGQKVFPLQMRGLGCFPDCKRARVLWVGAQDAGLNLSLLAERVETVLTASGFEKSDKPFSAHLTLARFPYPSSCFPEMEKYQETLFGEFAVNKISLIQSVLHPSGPVYTGISEFPLES